MRRKLLASTALTSSAALAANAALATELHVPRPLVALYSWSGCYAGLNAGGASVSQDPQLNVPGVVFLDSSGRDSGFVGGGQIGCNWQYNPRWVVGLEGDIEYLRVNRTGNLGIVHK